MKGRFWKKITAGALALLLVSGGVSMQPIAEYLNPAITASALSGSLSGEGTKESPYLIEDADDWATFASNINSGIDADKYYKLTADITVSKIVGTSTNRFKGTFFGGCHTLTLNYTASANDCAPFLYIENAAINTLKVIGDISTGYKYAAGIAAHSYGNCTIKNCISSISVQSTVSGDGTHAGFVAVHESGTLTMTNCLFDGSITGSNTTNCGGFVGWRNGTLKFISCMMAGTMDISQTDGSALFNRNGSSTLNNCYYDGSKSYGSITVQGTSTTDTGETLREQLGSGWAVSDSGVVPVFAANNLAIASLNGVSSFYPYTGNEIVLDYTVTTADGTLLTKGTDFTETVSPSTVQEKGDYTLTVDGIGSYTGSQTFHFTVGEGIPVTDETTTMTTGTYAAAGEVTISSRITVSGDVVLILYDGCTMNAEKGIFVEEGNSLTIDAQSAGDSMGTLIAAAEDRYAGIGGDYGKNTGTVTVNGGNITAQGGKDGAGIGGGCSKNNTICVNNGTTIINGGNVTAQGGSSGAGIGGGSYGSCGTTIINGGTITATGGNWGAGIGGGLAYSGAGTNGYTDGGGTVTINGGTITATGRDFSVGIGGGENGKVQSLTINGGNIRANKPSYGAGIGNVAGTILLSYTKATDSIYASSYDNVNEVSIAQGRSFTDGSGTIYTSETPSDTLKGLTEKTLTPVAYNVIVSECKDITVTAQDKAVDGETVVLTVTPSEGYLTDTVKFNGTEIVPVDGVYSFTMPVDDVTITATAKPDPSNFSQNGDTYTIYNETGWNVFCDALDDGESFSGKTVELGDNITVSRMAGSNGHEFCGTFYGSNKKLTFNATAADNYLAPFNSLKGSSETDHAVIRNLKVETNITAEDYRHMSGLIAVVTGYVDVEKCNVTANISSTVGTNNPSDLYPSGIVSQVAGSTELSVSGCTVDGTIATDGKYAAGIIGIVQGSATIENSVSGVTIDSSVNGDGSHGGLVGVTNTSTTLIVRGCVFNGKLLGSNTDRCGGFVGWRGGGAEIYDSIFDPAEVKVKKDNSATFARNKIDTYNSYYTYLLNDGTNYAPYLDDGSVTPKKYNNGQQAYTITPGADVTLGLSGTATADYDVSDIHVYASGIECDGKLYVCSGETVDLSLNYTGTPATGYTMKGYTASAGTLNGNTLTMPAENVTINADFDVESYFDANTGTLTLKGTVLNSNHGIILPNGVSNRDVQSIVVDSSGATLPQDSSGLFASLTSVTSIDLANADTSGVTDMSGLFAVCVNLTSLNVTGFDTSSVENMRCMFESCKKLMSLDLSSFDTSSVENMSFVFYGCEQLTTIYVSDKWSTGSEILSDCMFQDCSNLKGGNNTIFDPNYLDNTYAVIDKEGQPGYLTGTYTLTLPGDMAIEDDANENDKIGDRYLKGAVVRLQYTGADPSEHYCLVVKANDTELTGENGEYMLTMPDSNVTVTTAFEAINYNINITQPANGSVSATVGGTANAATAHYGDTVTLTITPNAGYTVKSVKYNDTVIEPDNGVYSFTMPDENVTVTAELDVESYFDASTGTLTLKGTVVNGYDGIILPNGVNKDDVQKIVVDSSVATLPQDSSGLFWEFGSVQSIDLTRTNTSSVTDMSGMFDSCVNLTSLNMTGFDTRSVEDMSCMFENCEKLTTLDLSSFDTSSVETMERMFDSCGALTTIYVSDKWDAGSVTDSHFMFDGCTNLKGGSGTAYDSNYIDKTYARIDKGEEAPGYLTGLFALTLPDNMEIMTDAENKVGSKYLSGAVVTLRYNTVQPGYILTVKANGTELTADENGIYTITITDSDVTVTADLDVESYFDAETGILTLKGIVVNGGRANGMILPNGVDKRAVRRIVVDSSGATLPADSSWLFYEFTSVSSINLTNADISSVTDMSCMFFNCYGLTTLDLNGFDTSHVTTMGSMFYMCYSLTSLDLSSFNTTNVEDMSQMFVRCFGLKTIYVSDKWNVESVTDSGDMFNLCTNLKGGNGTTVSAEDKTYARIDQDGLPGYLTGTYALTLPDNMEIVTDAENKVGSRYLKDSVVTFRYTDTIPEGYRVVVKANNTRLTEENGVYSFTMPAEDVVISAEFGFSDGIGAKLEGYSISLDGDIGVNFYMVLADDIAKSDTAYMQFTIPNGRKTEIKKIPVKNASVEGGYYIFKCSVAAKEMNSTIKAQIFDGNGGSGTEYIYSVKEYADYLLANANENGTAQQKEYAKAAPLVKAMLHYGAAAQEQFGSVNPPANTGIDSNGWENVTAQTINKPYDKTTEKLPEGTIFDGATLSLKSQTSLSLYFKSDAVLEFSCEGMTVEKDTDGEYQIARIRNISAEMLSEDFTVSLGNGYEVTFCPLTYCYFVLSSGDQPDSLEHVAQTLYLYWVAANEYFEA